ncbi:hypothetical protein BDF22DRAFT_746911 [Syncephalis plumigaleata]|nr:hypothetical protein BDF22DRAFT_746911 [Syncephalis plumigaleata]
MSTVDTEPPAGSTNGALVTTLLPIASPSSTLPLGNIDLVTQCHLGPFYRQVVTAGDQLPETFESHIATIPGRKKVAAPVVASTADEPSNNGGLMDLLLRPPQNEGVYMQNLDEDQLARAFRFYPGILHGYDASLLDQDDDDDEDEDDLRGSADGQLSKTNALGIVDGAGASINGDKSYKSGSSLDKKHKKKASIYIHKKKRKHERENETEEERRLRKKRKRERALAAAAANPNTATSVPAETAQYKPLN